jgi:multidrug transporter EmrE-like cation transporter
MLHIEERRMSKPSDAVTRSALHSEREGTSGRRRLTIASVALLLFAVVSAATGQVMLKHGMQEATAKVAHSGGSLALRAATSPWVLLGLVVFGVSAVAWLTALSRVPLSVAYPFNALGYLVILTASILVLHERANVLTWVGSLLVVSGLLIVVLTKPS